MAWERRGDQTYFYRSTKKNGKVKKEYKGNGVDAVAYAETFYLLKKDEKAFFAELMDLDESRKRIVRSCKILDKAMSKILRSEGFHKPKNWKWRKKQ